MFPQFTKLLFEIKSPAFEPEKSRKIKSFYSISQVDFRIIFSGFFHTKINTSLVAKTITSTIVRNYKGHIK